MNRLSIWCLKISIGLLIVYIGLIIASSYIGNAISDIQTKPLMIISDIALYSPVSFFYWMLNLPQQYNGLLFSGLFIVMAHISLVFIVNVAFKIARDNQVNNVYGSAKWGHYIDLENANMVSNEGIVLAQTNDAQFIFKTVSNKGILEKKLVMQRMGQALIRHAGPEHIFVYAPTRSGKGVGCVIPTLLAWLQSVIVHDIKGELWEATSGWRHQFSHCLRLCPSEHGGARFNPLLEIRKGDFEVKDVQNIADMLIDIAGEDQNNHWSSAAHQLLVGVILHVLYAEQDKTLGGVARFIANPDRDMYQTLAWMLICPHVQGKPHPVIASVARSALSKSERELKSIISVVSVKLALFQDPMIDETTSTSDFCIDDLMNNAAPVSLYLVVPAGDSDRIRPLIRLLLNQIGRRITEKTVSYHKTGYKHRLLMLLDEFPTLGHMQFFEMQLAYLAGYGIKCLLIAQGTRQLEKFYGQHHSILDNCHVQMTYGANDPNTAERISKMLGTTTAVIRKKSYSGSIDAPILNRISEVDQEIARSLMMPDEILNLPMDEALIFVGHMPPYKAKKVLFYEDKRFKGRYDIQQPLDQVQQCCLASALSKKDWDGLIQNPPTHAVLQAKVDETQGHVQKNQTTSFSDQQQSKTTNEMIDLVENEQDEDFWLG